MHPCLSYDPLRGPSRRVRIPRRGASKVDVMLGPERLRYIVTRRSYHRATLRHAARIAGQRCGQVLNSGLVLQSGLVL
jgi:hypothetical protein